MYRLTSKQDEKQAESNWISPLARRVQDEHSILSRIGNTPLVRLRNVRPVNSHVEIYAKAEWLNPGGSVKDRAALSMIIAGEKSGALTKDKIIIDATSGNTGIAYAMIGSILGYRVTLALPSNAGRERKQILRAYGAGLLLTDPASGTDGAQEFVREMVSADPGRYFYPDQYNNPANWQAHYTGTATEIWEQSDRRVTHFVAGLGTTGTFVGTSRRLKELRPWITCIAVQPDSPLHGVEGLKHLETAMVPGIYDPLLTDMQIAVSTEESYAMVRRLAREEGLYLGVSSGAAMAASLKVASRLSSGVIVTVFPDGGARYGSERFWEEKQEGERDR
ncbi:MAG: cysteine synthase family protein [Bacteroidota bacterium]